MTDFGTPVSAVTTFPQGENVRMIDRAQRPVGAQRLPDATPSSSSKCKPIKEDPEQADPGHARATRGEKLSLNFQNVEVRAVLQVIADFTGLNIITSDTVSGNLTLRLKDVPWDQALDIILQAKGLDMRKNGNVLWIAPQAMNSPTKEKLELEASAADRRPRAGAHRDLPAELPEG